MKFLLLISIKFHLLKEKVQPSGKKKKKKKDFQLTCTKTPLSLLKIPTPLPPSITFLMVHP